MHSPCRDHRTLERDAVLRAIRVLLHRTLVVLDGGVPVAVQRGRFALAKRLTGGAPGHQHAAQRQDGTQTAQT